jgi:hypothetical protein
VNLEKIFSLSGDRNVTVVMIAVVLGVYGWLTGDIRPFSVFALVIILVFLFGTLNFLMGKLKQ